MTPLSAWRARLPSSIGNWFARDLTQKALALVSDGRVALRGVENTTIDAAVRDSEDRKVVIEWTAGTGPLALRSLCSCGGNGICTHIVATLETVRSQPEPVADGTGTYDWLPQPSSVQAPRARTVWPVVTVGADRSVSAAFFLDSPRLRGVQREADAILTMMEATPLDDWSVEDRELLQDQLVRDGFAMRTNPSALARALFRLAHHPRVRLHAGAVEFSHPSELPPLIVDPRGLRLYAVARDGHFTPTLETVDGERISPANGVILRGPPDWMILNFSVFLLDGSFDPAAVLRAAQRESLCVDGRYSREDLARVAPILAPESRAELNVVDAREVSARVTYRWLDEALVAQPLFLDKAGGASAPYTPFGAVCDVQHQFIRFTREDAELIARRFLQAAFVPRDAGSFALHGADRVAEFLRSILPVWNDFENVLPPDLQAVVRGEQELHISLSAQPGGQESWFDLSFDVFADEGKPLSMKELSALLAGTGRYADVKGKLVDVSRLRRQQPLLNELVSQPHLGFASLLALHDELEAAFNIAVPAEIRELRERLRNFEGIKSVSPPAHLQKVLRPYQNRGLDFLTYLSSFRFGGVLADDMGIGKTIQTLAYLESRKERDGAKPSLVIAPTSVTHTWESEARRFTPGLRVLRLHSGSKRAEKYQDIAEADIVVTSYALARVDALRLREYYFRALILDEAQHAKNPASQIARVIRTLRAEHRLALTGTPVENSLRDLWSIFSFIEPGLLGTQTSFHRVFEAPISQGDADVTRRLHARLEPFVLRRTKKDVAPELPERTESIIECELSATQTRLYRAIAQAARRDIFAQIEEDGLDAARMHVLAALTRLRQVCAHPGLLAAEYIDEPQAGGKFEAFLETLEDIVGGQHRVLVFSAFSSMLKIMRKRLDTLEVPYGYLDGSVKDKDRSSEVARFMSPAGAPVFLCSLKAGGVGLTLTAADYVILYDPWWNPAVERQAVDRTHRIGQHRAVTAYRLITRGTVEQKIHSLAQRKATLSSAVIRTDSSLAKSLTREDLELLLADPVQERNSPE